MFGRLPLSQQHVGSTCCLLDVVALLLLFETVPQPKRWLEGKVVGDSSEGGARQSQGSPPGPSPVAKSNFRRRRSEAPPAKGRRGIDVLFAERDSPASPLCSGTSPHSGGPGEGRLALLRRWCPSVPGAHPPRASHRPSRRRSEAPRFKGRRGIDVLFAERDSPASPLRSGTSPHPKGPREGRLALLRRRCPSGPGHPGQAGLRSVQPGRGARHSDGSPVKGNDPID